MTTPHPKKPQDHALMLLTARETRMVVEGLRVAARLYEREKRAEEALVCLQVEHCLREGGSVEGQAW